MRSIGIIALMTVAAGVYEAAVNHSDVGLITVAVAIGLAGCLAAMVVIIASMTTKTGEHTHDDDQSGGGGGQVPARQHRSRRGDAGARESGAITPLGVRRVH